MDMGEAGGWSAPYLRWYSRPQSQVHVGNVADLIHERLAILKASTQENECILKTECILFQITFLKKSPSQPNIRTPLDARPPWPAAEFPKTVTSELSRTARTFFRTVWKTRCLRGRKGGEGPEKEATREARKRRRSPLTKKKGDVRACSGITCCVIYMGPGFLQEHIFLH